MQDYKVVTDCNFNKIAYLYLYQKAHKYLSGHFQDCLYDQYAWGSDFYYSGCSCGPKYPHTYRCETLVNARGYVCITFVSLSAVKLLSTLY